MHFCHGHHCHHLRRQCLGKSFEFLAALAAASNGSRDTSAKAQQKMSPESRRAVGARRRPTIRCELTLRLMRPKISGK
jgi:hypothetical protein